jgi:hypothetical protein
MLPSARSVFRPFMKVILVVIFFSGIIGWNKVQSSQTANMLLGIAYLSDSITLVHYLCTFYLPHERVFAHSTHCSLW